MAASVLTVEEETRRGNFLVQVLGLRALREGRNGPSPTYRTAWGSKTALGVFRVVERIVLDGE